MFDIENKILTYNEVNINAQLPSIVLSDGEMCDYLQKYDQTTMHKASYSYKYINNEMKLIEIEKTTVKDLIEEYNCK